MLTPASSFPWTVAIRVPGKGPGAGSATSRSSTSQLAMLTRPALRWCSGLSGGARPILQGKVGHFVAAHAKPRPLQADQYRVEIHDPQADGEQGAVSGKDWSGTCRYHLGSLALKGSYAVCGCCSRACNTRLRSVV
jgi:hypothetical protein